MQYTPDSTDEALRQGCLAGDRRARELFYRRYYGKLLGLPLRYTADREAANAILNQAFLKIFSSLPNYREEGNFAGWLSTIVFRTTMSELRRQKPNHEVVSIHEAFHHPPTSAGIDETYDVEEIYRHVQALPPPLRSVFSLYVIDDRSHEEITKILGITLANSRWRLNQARRRLRTSLRPQQAKPK